MKTGARDGMPAEGPSRERKDVLLSSWMPPSAVTMGEKSFGVFAALRDVTQGVRRKKELRKYREHLEELVEERTLCTCRD